MRHLWTVEDDGSGEKIHTWQRPGVGALYDGTGKLHCISCNTGIRARPSDLDGHVATERHNASIAAKKSALLTQRPALQQSDIHSSAQQHQPQHKQVLTGIVSHLSSINVPLYGVGRILTPKFRALLDTAPRPLPTGQQLRNIYLPLAVKDCVVKVGEYLARWLGFIVLMEDETTERRAVSESCSLILASTPEGCVLLHVDLSDASVNGAAVAAALTASLTKYSVQWRHVLAVIGDNVAYNGTALKIINQAPDLGAKHVYRMRCGSHTLALLCKGTYHMVFCALFLLSLFFIPVVHL